MNTETLSESSPSLAAAFQPPDPLQDLIANLLGMEGMHADTALLIRLAVGAQQTGKLPDLAALDSH